jgi:hypothetical protein
MLLIYKRDTADMTRFWGRYNTGPLVLKQCYSQLLFSLLTVYTYE